MKEFQKPVWRSGLVMLSLFAAAVAGSGVAQAQECIARGTSVTARAEGITEEVGTIELRCAELTGLGFGSPTELEITVELNTRITSVIDDDRLVQGLTYTALSGTGVTDTDFTGAKLSEDGTTIAWEITSADVNLGGTNTTGFQVTIGGIKANASTVGDGEDVTAVVSVAGTAVHSRSLKLADVTTGLVVKVDKADTLQCETDAESEPATITIQEGFAISITDTNEFVVSFIGIPEGVTVKVPETEAALTAGGDVTAEMATASFGLMLKSDTRASGVTVEDGVGTVDLSSFGSGEIVYEVIDGTTADDVADERVDLTVTFEWGAGDVTDSGEVAVSFDPVSTMGGDTFATDGAPAERYVASGSHTVIDVSSCLTTLLFPFVLHQSGFDTGIAISNTSSESGSCTINYHGAGGPDPHESPFIAGGGQLIFTLSSTVDTTGFRGYLVAVCDFRKAYGFALILDGFGMRASTLAQGYLAVRDPWNKY